MLAAVVCSSNLACLDFKKFPAWDVFLLFEQRPCSRLDDRLVACDSSTLQSNHVMLRLLHYVMATQYPMRQTKTRKFHNLHASVNSSGI